MAYWDLHSLSAFSPRITDSDSYISGYRLIRELDVINFLHLVLDRIRKNCTSWSSILSEVVEMLLRAIYLSKKVVACRPLRSMANGDMSTCQPAVRFYSHHHPWDCVGRFDTKDYLMHMCRGVCANWRPPRRAAETVKKHAIQLYMRSGKTRVCRYCAWRNNF